MTVRVAGRDKGAESDGGERCRRSPVRRFEHGAKGDEGLAIQGDCINEN